jgi:TonB-linked SusC/RagA family outer membrane protein
MRLIVGLIAFSILLFGRGSAEQSPGREVRQVATAPQGRYVPLQTLLERRDRVPAALERRVTVRRQSELLQVVLVEIASQAGLGLSYSDEVARSRTLVSIDAVQVPAAEVLTRVVEGTPWRVLVTPQAQVTVVRAPRTGAIRGQVTDTATGRGVHGVEVLLEGTRWRTETDTAGWYRLSEVDVGTYTLHARRPGYARQSRRVTVHEAQEDTVHIALPPLAVALDELVTTATGQQRRRDLGNAITTIHADSVLATAPIRNLTDLLENRVPGMTMRHTSGAPGDPSRVRLRGLGSVLRSNDPVVIVDGVRVYAAQADKRSGNLTNELSAGSKLGVSLPAPSPLDQIDPNIIEKIEVFKGPSAATLYGADAANGVIVVTTKRGRPGPTRWSAGVQYGRTHTIGRYPEGFYRWGSSSINNSSVLCLASIDIRCERQDSLVRFQALNDPALTPLGQGHRTSLSLTASGGTNSLSYSLTGTYADETGLLKLPAYEVERFRARFNRAAPDWMRRPHHFENWSVTSNIGARLSPVADVALTTTLSRSEQQRTELERRVTSLAGTYVDTVNGRYYAPAASSGNYGFAQELLADYFRRTTASTISFTTGINANWNPNSWFRASGNAGLNVIPRDDESLLPSGLISAADSGAIIQGTGRSLVSTFNLRGTARKPLGAGFVFETSVGANLTGTNTSDLVIADTSRVPGTNVPSGAGRITGRAQETSVFGWYIEPRISGQRFSLSTGLRLDGGSAYGARVSSTGLLGLPKLNGSWVISEEPFFPFKALFSSLRLRGGYGQAQVQPGPADRLRLYDYSTLDGASVTLRTLGNGELRPERATEFEGGFDADLLDGRVSLEVTAYRKTTVDALMTTQLPASVGGGAILQNIGNVRNTGLELVLGLTPVQIPEATWSAQLIYSRNNNVLTKLGRGVEPNASGGIVEGYPVGGRWVKPILGYADDNDNGRLDFDEIRVGDSLVYMGRLLPEYTMSLHTSVDLFDRSVSLSAGFSYESGATQIDDAIYNNAPLVRGLVDPAAPFSEQAAALASVNVPPDGATIGSGGRRTEYGLMQDVSLFRFTSLSVSYRAPQRVARFLRAEQLSVAIQGDNLGLHSTYRGKDPNVGAAISGEGIRDSGQIPRPRTWQIAFSLRY